MSMDQDIINNMIEDVTQHTCVLDRKKIVSLFIPEKDKSSIIGIAEDGSKNYFSYVPEEFNNEKIHGNTRNKIAKMFLEQVTLEQLYKLHTEFLHKQEEENRQREAAMSMSPISKYRNYLKKELIPDVNYEISENRIHVNSKDTCYCDISKPSILYDQKVIIKLYNDIVRTARKNHIKLSFKNKTKETIMENFSRYIADYNTAQKLFNKCKRYFQSVQKHGLHYGTLDDIILNKAENIRNEYTDLFNRNKPLCFIPEIYSHLLETEQEIEENPEQYTKICL